SRFLRGGKANAESAAAIWPVAVRLDPSAVHLYELLHDRKADAQAALTARDRALALREELKHLRDSLRRDADAIISDSDRHIGGGKARRQLDASTGGRVFRGVGEEIENDLLQPRRVGLHP